MKRIIDIDMECRCKKLSTALNRFFKKYPNLIERKETLEWMGETSTDFLCDNKFADGRENKDWCYALHLDIGEDYYYIAVIERA